MNQTSGQTARRRPNRQRKPRLPAASRSLSSADASAAHTPAGSIPPRRCRFFRRNESSRHHTAYSQIVPTKPSGKIPEHPTNRRKPCRPIRRRRKIRRQSNPLFPASPPKPPLSRSAAGGTAAPCIAYASTIQQAGYARTDSIESAARASSTPSSAQTPADDSLALSSDPSNRSQKTCRRHNT